MPPASLPPRLQQQYEANVETLKMNFQMILVSTIHPLWVSCNDLICLLLDPPPSECYPKSYENIRLLLWNPSTRKARKLPDIDLFRFGPLYYGLGYDSTAQDYKVFLGGFNYPDDPGLVAIFALKTGSWKIVGADHIDASLIESRRRGCFLNGALHWNQNDRRNKGTKIWSFDFAQEKFRSFSFVRHKGYTTDAGLGTIGNLLFFYTACHSLTNHHDLEDAGLTIWVMMEYEVDQSWTIFAKFRSEIFPSDVKWVMPISHMEDDGEVLMQSSQGHLVLYTKEDEEEEDTCKIVLNIPGIEEIPALYVQAVIYVETLVSPVTGNA